MNIYKFVLRYRGERLVRFVKAVNLKNALYCLDQKIADLLRNDNFPPEYKKYVKIEDDLKPIVEYPDCPLHFIEDGWHICQSSLGRVGDCILSGGDCYITGCPMEIYQVIAASGYYLNKEDSRKIDNATRVEAGHRVVSVLKIVSDDPKYRIYLETYCHNT